MSNQQSNNPTGEDGVVQGAVKRKRHTKPYVIERRYIGADNTMWRWFKHSRDWRVDSRFAKASDRDHQLEKLQRDPLYTKYWEYRAVDL